MLMELKYLLIKIDNINHFHHQHLFKIEPFVNKNLSTSLVVKTIGVRQTIMFEKR